MWFLLSILVACNPESQPKEVSETPVESLPGVGYVPPFRGEPLADNMLLRRMSFDLRGIPPAESDLAMLEADPQALESIVDSYLDDERHEEQLVSLFSEWLLTRVDVYNVDHRDYRLDSSQAFSFLQSVGEEPLRLMAYIAYQDLPWTEIVTADYSMANELLLDIWPMVSLEDATGWRPASYTDGRPAGGVVMSNGLWWRYYTTPNNFSRTRAMALADLFLCENYLERPIKFSAPSLLDRDSLNEVIRTNEACIGCHSTLDPIAAVLFGFWWFDLYDTAEMTAYHPEREQLGRYYLQQEPAWFGRPLSGPSELGLVMSNDRRLISCTVERVTSLLWRRNIETADLSHLQTFQQDFEAGNLRFRSLLKAILFSDDYRVGKLASDATSADADKLMTRRLITADHFVATVEHLTGFVWRHEGFDQLSNDLYGYRILAGGIDGVQATQSARNPSLSRQLTIKRVAQAAADYAVEREKDLPLAERILFNNVDFENIGQADSSLEDALRSLHRRFYSQDPSPERLALDVEYWTLISQQNGNLAAWKSLVAVLFRDPSFWSY